MSMLDGSDGNKITHLHLSEQGKQPPVDGGKSKVTSGGREYEVKEKESDQHSLTAKFGESVSATSSSLTSLSEPSQFKPSDKQQQILSQINQLIPKLKDGFSRERLTQIANYCSSAHPLDLYFKEEERRCLTSETEEEIEQYCNELIEEERLSISRHKNIFSIATEHYYDTFDMKGKKIVITGEVSRDGWGDYFQMWLTAINLAELFPESSLSVCTDISFRTPPVLSKRCQKAKDLVSATEFQAADLFIGIPHAAKYPYPKPAGKPAFNVEECGFPPVGGFALGFDPHRWSYVGLPLTKVSDANSLEELVHVPLKAYLTAGKRPFFIGYLKDDYDSGTFKFEQRRASFILAAAASQANLSGDFDIICALDELMKLDQKALMALNIGRVIALEPDHQGNLIEKQWLEIQPEGKTIRILNAFPLSNDDWMLLLKFCEPLVGCTGDMSFIEVLSNRKIPFYQIMYHKVEFVKQLIKLTGYIYQGQFVKLHKLFKTLLSTLSDQYSLKENFSRDCAEIGKMVDEEFVAEMHNLVDCVQKYYNANEILALRVKRALAQGEHPELKRLEQELLKRWMNEEITLEAACQQLQERVALITTQI
jgi:hypothetical protein